jgi:DNA-binding transcriptional MerR regulator
MDNPLTVGRLAKQTGLSARSIRYYEQEKLIPRARRSASGYRLYSPAVIGRLRFIQKARSIGFAVDDIRRILELTDQGEPCCERVYDWSERKLGELDDQIRFLSSLRDRLLGYRQDWQQLQGRGPAMSEAEICGLIESVELPRGPGR